jgi:hypothetical protein
MVLAIENRSTTRKHIPVTGYSQNTYVSPVSINFVGKREIKAVLFVRFYTIIKKMGEKLFSLFPHNLVDFRHFR